MQLVDCAAHLTGLAPGVPHFANLPFASLQRVTAGTFGVHLMNLPFVSRQGAARLGADPAINPRTDIPMMMLRILDPLNSAGRS
jgi:hypothetical protein